jgi:hypothetical protein
MDAPAEQSRNAKRMRGLKNPDLDVDRVFIGNELNYESELARKLAASRAIFVWGRS